jgi:hypothetical protein
MRATRKARGAGPAFLAGGECGFLSSTPKIWENRGGVCTFGFSRRVFLKKTTFQGKWGGGGGNPPVPRNQSNWGWNGYRFRPRAGAVRGPLWGTGVSWWGWNRRAAGGRNGRWDGILPWVNGGCGGGGGERGKRVPDLRPGGNPWSVPNTKENSRPPKKGAGGAGGGFTW